MNHAQHAIQYLTAYAQYMESSYEGADHVVELASYLEAVEAGDIKRLIITMPPRHSKSYNVAEFFPAWYLGRNPSKYVIYTTYEQGLASSFGRKVRNQLQHPRFKSAFPECNISRDSTSKKEFTTEERGQYYAIGRGGAITGKGADLFIADDMFKNHKEAASKLIREDLKKWFKAIATTRLQEDAAMILMGTRWNKDDLIGWALRELSHENWMLVNMPAINKQGHPLWGDKYSKKRLMTIKKTIGTYFWNALYMQRPSEEEGNIWKRKDWRYWKELPPKFDKRIQSWDMNFEEGITNSYVCGQVWGKIGADCYLVDQYRKQVSYSESKRAIVRMAGLYPKFYKKLIEKRANAYAILNELSNVIGGFDPVEPEGSKEVRALAEASAQESGNVYIPHPSIKSWVDDYIDEHADFPNSEFNDQVDCTSQALKYLNKGGGVDSLKKFLEW
jgi:predicted phage terminase large subunit-like protein